MLALLDDDLCCHGLEGHHCDDCKCLSCMIEKCVNDIASEINASQSFLDMIANKWNYTVCSSASNTPQGITWDDHGTTITGELVASENTMYTFYLVPAKRTATGDVSSSPRGTW